MRAPAEEESPMNDHEPRRLDSVTLSVINNAYVNICREIGGRAPGSFAADATEVYQEGLRLPPVKIISRGQYNRDVWKIILSNHRTPDTSWGDYHAMIGSLHIAEKRLHELLARYGAAFL